MVKMREHIFTQPMCGVYGYIVGFGFIVGFYSCSTNPDIHFLCGLEMTTIGPINHLVALWSSQHHKTPINELSFRNVQIIDSKSLAGQFS